MYINKLHNIMAIEKKLLNKLKRDLKGLMSQAAQEIGLSPASISRILDAKQENNDVLLKLIRFRDMKQKEKSDSIQNLRKELSRWASKQKFKR